MGGGYLGMQMVSRGEVVNRPPTYPQGQWLIAMLRGRRWECEGRMLSGPLGHSSAPAAGLWQADFQKAPEGVSAHVVPPGACLWDRSSSDTGLSPCLNLSGPEVPCCEVGKGGFKHYFVSITLLQDPFFSVLVFQPSFYCRLFPCECGIETPTDATSSPLSGWGE